MSTLRKELVKQIIADGKLSNPKDIGDYLKDMFKDVIQEMLEQELSLELGYDKGDSQSKNTDNRRNGHSKKTVKSQFGNLEFDIPRDRNSEFQPQIIPKNTRDIHDQIQDLYGIEMSAEHISHITNTVIEDVMLWQNRPLEHVYTFVFMECNTLQS